MNKANMVRRNLLWKVSENTGRYTWLWCSAKPRSTFNDVVSNTAELWHAYKPNEKWKHVRMKG